MLGRSVYVGMEKLFCRQKTILIKETMMIVNILKDLKVLSDKRIAYYPNDARMVRTMFEAVENTLLPYDVDNESRLAVLIRLIMLCPNAQEKTYVITEFTNSIIAADYFFSVKIGEKAVHFLNKALMHFTQLLGNENESTVNDTETFIDEFQVTNLKGQQDRLSQAIKNILILNGSAQKLDVDLSLSEILLDYTPTSWCFKDMPFVILLCIVGGTLFSFPLTECMSPWRKSIQDGVPVSLLDAFAPMDMPYLFIGLIIIALAIFMVYWSGTPNNIQWMSKWAYWRFCK